MLLISLIVASFCIWLLHYFLKASHPLIADQPNERSLHVRPVPRVGGLAVVGASVVGLAIVASLYTLPLPLLHALGAGIAVFVVSLVDDVFGLSAAPRLLVQTFAAGVTVAGGLSLEQLQLGAQVWALSTLLGGFLSLLFIVWFINLYNFMDGMDGFAGGMGVVGFGCYALLGVLADAEVFALISIAVAAACAGFLTVNFPPAKMFMGDSGASTLGFLAAAMGLWADVTGIFPIWVAVLAFAPFTFDATVTLLRRLLTGKKIWEAHREHFYQRLVLNGWSHRRTVLWEYLLMLVSAALAIVAAVGGAFAQNAVLVASATLYVCLGLLLRNLE